MKKILRKKFDGVSKKALPNNQVAADVRRLIIFFEEDQSLLTPAATRPGRGQCPIDGSPTRGLLYERMRNSNDSVSHIRS